MLCRLSVNPETCILRSAESFYKRGKMTLLIAKFIPGVNTMAPPLAGSMKMRPWQFLRFDIAGAALYASAYIALGYIFRRFLALITRSFIAASHLVEAVVFVAIAAYVVYRIWLYRKNAMYRIVPRVQVHELAQRLAMEEGEGRWWLMCAATDITIPARCVSRDRYASSPITCRRKSSISARRKTFFFTALERAKRLAPGWRICCGKKDSTRSSSSADWRRGRSQACHWSRCRTMIW